jgi:small subunit ribosomal protein S20
MPHSNSARKRARQNVIRRTRNRSQRSALRTQIKKTLAAIESGDAKAATEELTRTTRHLDRAAQKGLIHKNQAARRKSRLHARLAAVQAGEAAATGSAASPS